MNVSQKGKEAKGSKIPKERTEKYQRRNETGYDKTEYNLVFRRETCKQKQDLRKSKILIYSQ